MPKEGRSQSILRNPHGPLGKYVEAKALRIQYAITAETPRHTGRLARSVRKGKVKKGLNGPRVDIQVGRTGQTGYLGYILYGTAPHIIVPRTKKALRFISNGSVVFATKVHHPGTRPNDFVTRGFMKGARG